MCFKYEDRDMEFHPKPRFGDIIADFGFVSLRRNFFEFIPEIAVRILRV